MRWCYTDFYLATKINFLSGERVVCSAKLGPTTTEYFFDYRERGGGRARRRPSIAVNATAAEKLERRLERLGVTYERRDLMKPVLLRLSRKVEPAGAVPGPGVPMEMICEHATGQVLQCAPEIEDAGIADPATC